MSLYSAALERGGLAMPHAIVHMFDRPFVRVMRTLPRLQRMGFSHVLVSPPQLSHPSPRWWARYQPIDFQRIEGPLGDARALAKLCHKAAERGLCVMVDAVLNHMTNLPELVQCRGGRVVSSRLPRFGPEHFRPLRHWTGAGPPLPELRHDDPHVFGELRRYLEMLAALGVRGLRIDAAENIDSRVFGHLLQGLPFEMVFGEFLGGSPGAIPESWLAVMAATDAPLAHNIRAALGMRGDLRNLLNLQSRGGAIWGPKSISFVNSHDLARHRRGFDGIRLPRALRPLGYAHILSRQDGTPCVYEGDLRLKEVKGGVKFHAMALGQPERVLLAAPKLLVTARGHSLISIIHSGAAPTGIIPVGGGLREGRYVDLISGHHVWLRGGQIEAQLGPFEAALLAAC